MCPPCRRAVNGDGGLLARGHMVCHVLLVEGPRGLVLVDTGLGTQDMADPRDLGGWFNTLCAPVRDEAQTALHGVRALGFDPADVRDLVVTHLDLDHAGGMPDFRHARVHVHRRELDAARNRATSMEKRRYVPRHFEGADFAAYDDREGDTWMGLPCVRGLEGQGDEILFVPLPGHTRGHSAVAVRGERGWMLHGGDAWFHHGEMANDPPTCPAGLRAFQKIAAMNDARRRESQARIREALRGPAREVQAFCAHDPLDLERMRGASAP